MADANVDPGYDRSRWRWVRFRAIRLPLDMDYGLTDDEHVVAATLDDDGMVTVIIEATRPQSNADAAVGGE